MASAYTLEFEKPLLELERQIEDLKRIGTERQIDIDGELEGLQGKLESLRADIYRNLTPIQRVMVARHPRRPYTLDYLSTIFTDFIELHGDRLYLDDPAIVGGWARLAGISVMVIGHQKGRDTKENLKRNFGMPHPEGYRKALRLMKLGREVQRAGHHAHRHAGRLPRPGRRGARPVGGAGAEHPRDVGPARRPPSPWSSARAARAARSRSASPTGSSCWRTRCTR